MINRLPWRKKLRTSAANNLDKINEVIDYINHSDISPVTLSDSASGRIVDVGMASSMKGLEVFGESVQNGVPSPDAPVPIQVVRGRNLLENTATSRTVNGVTFTVNDDKSITASGTASADISLTIGTMTLPGGSYFLSGCPSNGSWSTYCLQLTDNPVTTNKGIDSGSGIAVTVDDGDYAVKLHIANGQNVSNLVFKPQLEEGTTATPYVPYGHIGLRVTVDGETTVTPIPLPSKGWAGASGNGMYGVVADKLLIDSAGHVQWKIRGNMYHVTEFNNYAISGSQARLRTPRIASSPMYISANYQSPEYATCNRFRQYNESVFNRGPAGTFGYYSSDRYLYFRFNPEEIPDLATANTWLENNPTYVLLFYNTENEQNEDMGYINVPAITDGATVTIEATITPEFTLDWWSYQDITDMIADLKEYTDWKVSQVEGASTLGNNRLDSLPTVKEIAEIGKIEDEEEPAETGDEEMPEEIEDTEVQ